MLVASALSEAATPIDTLPAALPPLIGLVIVNTSGMVSVGTGTGVAVGLATLIDTLVEALLLRTFVRVALFR